MAIGRRNRRVRERTNTTNSIDHLITNLTGRRVKVEYFHKQISGSETLLQFDINESGHLQNFNRIKDLLIYVQNEVPATGDITQIKGDAYINVDITPTIGDVFIIPINGHQYALMTMSNIKRYSYNDFGVHHIEYSAIKIIESMHDYEVLKSQLESGVLTELQFDESSFENGNNPLIKPSIYELITKMRGAYERALKNFHKTISKQNVVVPEFNGQIVVDENIMNFMKRTLGSELNNFDDRIIRTDEDRDLTILDYLLGDCDFDSILIYNVNKEEPISPKNLFSSIFLNYNNYMKRLGIIPPKIKDGKYYFMGTENLLYVDDGVNDLVPSLNNETYIFSESFYGVAKQILTEEEEADDEFINAPTNLRYEANDFSNNDTGNFDNGDPINLLEEETRNFIKAKTYNVINLEKLLNGTFKFNLNQHIYFSPIIFFLASNIINDTVNEFY